MTDIATRGSLLRPPEPVDERWWREAVVYQVYPRSWASSGSDGVGDLPGITAHLPYLRDLGVDAVWISPFYASPQEDAGYDVSDHRSVDPRFGTVADVEHLLEVAHGLGLRVVADVIPNHVSRDHPWFRAALAGGPGAPERDRFVFRPGRGTDGSEPPNNWRSEFGGPAWTRVTEPDGSAGPWYLHQFDTSQPDVDWEHPDVVADFEDTLRFWLDRGLDGFRVDAAHCIIKAPGLPDAPVPFPDPSAPTHLIPYRDQEGCHDVYRGWRRLVDTYDPPRLLCAEAWVTPLERAMRYVRPGEMHQAFNLEFLDAGWDAGRVRRAVVDTVGAVAPVGASPTWVLANHDTVRLASRLGLPAGSPNVNGKGLHPDGPRPDPALGLRRARAAALLMLALPGSAYVYQGEELGLPEAPVPDDARSDPTFGRTGGTVVGRDGARVPMPWVRDAPGFGFGTGGRTWLPQPPEFGPLAVDQQEGVAGSTLELHRAALAERRARRLGRGGVRLVDGWPDSVLALAVSDADGAELLVVTNFGDVPVPLGDGADVVLRSDGAGTAGGEVPPDTTVWATRTSGPGTAPVS